MASAGKIRLLHKLPTRRLFAKASKNSVSASSVCQQNNQLHTSQPLASLYGGRHTVTFMPGDGVGPELMGHIKEVFRFAGAPVDFEEIDFSSNNSTDADMDNAMLAIKRNGIAIKGNRETNFDTPGFKSRNVQLRTELDLFANVLWCKSIDGVKTRHDNIDIIIIRENTEGEYKNLEHENVSGVVESLKIITADASRRIAKYAFDFATKHGRKKVTAIHKANIMKLGDGLFLKCCKEVSELYPDIQYDSMIVDNCSMQLVSKPQQFDVMVMPNLYGNIISNIGAGLVGGPGVVPGMNVGTDYAVFESGCRNTGKHIAGKNIANPTGMLLAGVDLLVYLGLEQHAGLIQDSVINTISQKEYQTPDLGGQATSTEVVQAIIDDIKFKTQERYKKSHS
ncbi:unnamed protein product [Owenia fusiformis]|uniref:Isocitrate dehydrogenase [NAD] subunit, mitochondrial n=1 Tax=Owenia fusiformis TaxID=6347 RepID=A0A8J1XG77_OWEFU|nr:unnamed protein product [Owenia fusiformis]